MFRRAPVLAHGLLLPTTRDCMSADIAWVFGMALLGRLRFVPEAVCRKRYYAESTSTGWKPRPAHRLSLVSTLVRYARSYAGSTRATAVALAGIARVTLASLIAGPVRRRRVRRLMRRAAADSA